MTQPDPNDYVATVVSAILSGTDVGKDQLVYAAGVAVKAAADGKLGDDTVARLRVAVLALGGASGLDVVQEGIELARSQSGVPSQADPLGGIGTLLAGGPPPMPGAAPQPATATPDPAATATQPAAPSGGTTGTTRRPRGRR